MNTPAHVIYSLVLLGRENAAKFVIAIAAGAVLPDLFMILFYAYEKLLGTPEQVIWQDHYYRPFWQNLFDTTNSLPLLGIALAVAWYTRHRAWALLFASMMIHCLLDFPVHHDDGHRHFFPFSEFRFRSPVSYWDPEHYGNLVAFVEMASFLFGAVFLWRGKGNGAKRAKTTRLRIVIILTATVYIGFIVFVVTTWMDM